MEATPDPFPTISKKRKRSSSSDHPFMGIFTRSKSQIYLHHNRSGLARTDSFSHSKHHANLRSCQVGFLSKTQFQTHNKKARPKSETALTQDSLEAEDWSSTFIQDLRARRVFSLATMDNDCGLCVVGEEKKRPEEGVGGFEDGFSCDSKNKEAMRSSCFNNEEDFVGNCLDSKKEEENKDMGYSGKEQNNIGVPVTDIRSADNGEISNGVGDLNEDYVQATPPDAEILNWEHLSPNPSSENLQKSTIDEKVVNNSGPKLGLNPWSRVKLFKAPGSISYRRLLPYLIDMVQDNSGTPEKDKSPNIESQQMSIDEGRTESPSMEVQARDSVSQGAPDLASGLDNGTDSSIQFGQEKNQESSSGLDNPHTIGFSNDTKPVDSGEAKDVISKSTCNAPDANDMVCDLSLASKTIDPYPNVSRTEGNSYIANKEGSGDKTDDPNEESMQKAPQDADIFGKSVVYQNVDNKIKLASQSAADQVLEKPMNGSSHRNNGYFSDKRMDSISKTKLGLKPCSPLKLFNIGSSFGYRRLLPYLMNIAKDNSGGIGKGHCPKLEKSLEESPLSKLSVSDIDETPVDKSNDRSDHMDHDTASCTLQVTILPVTKHSCGSNQPNLKSSDNNNDTPVSVGLQEEQELQVADSISDDKVGQSDAAPSIVSLVNGTISDTTPSCSLVSPKSSSGDCLGLVSHEISVDHKEVCRISVSELINAAKPVGLGNLYENSSKLEASNPLGILSHDSRKGILKKYPRGCRGFCTCLNCGSFRLHAERAFEFSRNQMQDAEEVAIDLIKELSQLRNMLEKTAFGCDDNLIICVNKVKKACKKASEAEELAKSRLSQMNYDLNVHCRITCGERPRVRFSNNVEERIFSQVNSEESSK